jgi:hypothetical protein
MLRSAIGGLVLCVVACAATAGDRTVTLILENKSNFEVSITIPPAPNEQPKTFPVSQSSPKRFEYQHNLPDGRWFNRVPITITWNNANLRNNVALASWDQQIVLRMRRDFPKEFYLPIFFSNDRTQSEMDRLERHIDSNNYVKLAELFLRGGQIADFYWTTVGPQNSYTRRATWLSFLGSVQLAEFRDYFIEVSDEITSMAEKAHENIPSKKEFILDRAQKARSVYFEDVNWIGRLIDEKDCKGARVLLDSLRQMKEREGKFFELRFPKAPNLLEEKEQLVTLRCVTKDARM